MKRLFFAFAAVIASAGMASAQSPAPAPGCAPGPIPPASPAPAMYGPSYGGYGGYGGGHMMHGGHGFVGGHGLFSGLFTNHPHKGKSKGFGRDDRPVNMLPVAQGGGTLVFPQNPFIRSPRDWFMYDEK